MPADTTRKSTRLGSRKVAVDDLRPGMFVCKLDRDWLETPFLLQGFRIEHASDIAKLREYCRYVWIDVAEEVWEGVGHESTHPQDPGRRQIHAIKQSAQAEHARARKIYDTSRTVTKNLLTKASSGPPIAFDQAESTVQHCVDSILSNPDALLWMSKIRDQDEYTAEHCLNVCILAIAFGRHLQLAEQQLFQLGMAGLLHDVGKMRVPSEILNKPGELSEKEMRAMRAHVVHGRNLLQQTPNIAKQVIEAAHAHHERLDGGGYPRKLDATDIGKITRLISIVDTFDAITSHRCYAPARPVTEALRILYEARGSQFDEALVLEFIQFIGLYPPGSIVELENGMVGLVIATNEEAHHLPKIIKVCGPDKQPCEQEFLDLSLTRSGELGRDHLIRQLHVDGSFGIFIRDFKARGLSFAIG
ncbi:HD-GYP domain-containing protein [Simiduia agarivorans]|uniref:HD domain-containing protein n=1 Tax=Simiduia agarivorans (strain DSM 21679 / JCM 13881 / BCRC 17597 / SA1) TaxID=1117647 RepID=K4KGR8_SIMAS|nr:HD-GYP domain-containing protein [Simiduia agarivorans]AFU97405.1 HD domain-containing protein [Simiduia agarivorans SA1 = DSM 21679]